MSFSKQLSTWWDTLFPLCFHDEEDIWKILMLKLKNQRVNFNNYFNNSTLRSHNSKRKNYLMLETMCSYQTQVFEEQCYVHHSHLVPFYLSPTKFKLFSTRLCWDSFWSFWFYSHGLYFPIKRLFFYKNIGLFWK